MFSRQLIYKIHHRLYGNIFQNVKVFKENLQYETTIKIICVMTCMYPTASVRGYVKLC